MDLRTARRAALAFGAVTTLTCGALVAPGSAGAATGSHCTATASPKHPHQYSTVHIAVNGNKAGAEIRTVAHFKTTSHAKHKKANRYGNATIDYDISDATKGYQVHVDATVTSGGSSGSCSTTFTPS